MNDVPSFRDTIALAATGDGGGVTTFHRGWAQGRATFGGVVAAAALTALRERVGRDPSRPLRTLTATFAGPVEPDVAATCRASVLREGRAVTLAEARIEQKGQPRFTATAVFGAARQSVIRIEPPPPPDVAPPDDVGEMPFHEGVTPEFIRGFSLRFALGNPPFVGGGEPHIGGWCRFRRDEGPADAEALLSLVDAWPAPVLPLMTVPAPASSITWSIDLLADATDRRADGWWLYEAKAVAAAEGYVQANAWLWDADGRAVARSTQTVAIYG